ncbi:MATE family efflux transporter [Salinarimonas ramus]|uniref:Multidrug-efflux transporter n=1 Tax=Salinarimonas ramus TaxID=690164 RepID=A0A917V5T2_9HYPH|nr:MATE family efflux transporter [Salinarimonas ramus]GGK40778.1 MATE family efflux transporter [Salinarimonas ramus]
MPPATDALTAAPPSGQAAWRREAIATLALSWPLILTNVAQTSLQATDVLMLSWLSPEALAAGALGSNLLFVCFIAGVGLFSAISAMIAAERGRKRHAVREVRRTVRQGFWAGVVLVVPAWAMLWNARTVLEWLGQDPVLSDMAADYCRAVMWCLLPAYFYLTLRNFVAALERPLLALAVGILAIGVNAALNWALIFGNWGAPALGLVGAGWATTLTNVFLFGALALLVLADRRARRYRVFGRFWRSDWPRFFQLWRLGLPVAAIVLFEVTIFSAAVFLMGLISTEALAAHQIAIQIASLSFMVPLGISMAATVRVGLAYGAGDREAVTRAGWIAFAMGVGFMACMALVMIFAPRLLVSAFLDVSDPANATVVALAVSYLALAGLFQVVDGAQAVTAGMLRGLHDTRIPMFMALTGYWLFGLPLAAGLAFWAGLEGVGIWIGLAGGLALTAVLLVWRWVGRERLGLLPVGRR